MISQVFASEGARVICAARSRDLVEETVASIRQAGDGWVLDGDLTIGEITRPQRLQLEFGGIEQFPGGARHAGFEATGELRRKDFGIDLPMPPGVSAVALGDVVKIELDIQLIEPA